MFDSANYATVRQKLMIFPTLYIPGINHIALPGIAFQHVGGAKRTSIRIITACAAAGSFSDAPARDAGFRV